jgi:hypothetical protein
MKLYIIFFVVLTSMSAGKAGPKNECRLTKPPVIEIIVGAELFVFIAAKDWLHESESYK